MAGIGFELRKIYKDKGIFARQRMELHAAFFYGGPLILGAILIMLVSVITSFAGMKQTQRYLLTSMITYAVIFSLFFSNVFSALLTRYISDMVYAKRFERILPAFLGSSLLMVSVGEIFYGIFLFFAGISPGEMLFSLVLFAQLTVLWSTISFITSIKEYKVVMKAFFIAILITCISSGIFVFFRIQSPQTMLLAVCLGYGIILYSTVSVLYKILPMGREEHITFAFLEWFDRYPKLILMGMGIYLGAFLHIVCVWFTGSGMQIQGLFYNAPYYDVPAFYAFLTTILSTVNFAVFIEVEFYEKFKRLYGLYGNGGTLGEIREAEQDMLFVLKNQLKYLAWKQAFFSMLVIFAGAQILEILPLGFNNMMLGYFRILCLAYGIFGIAQSMLLVLLYFDDIEGAAACGIVYGLINIISGISIFFISPEFYGFGFLISNIVFYIMTLHRLEKVTDKLTYMVLGRQPIIYHKINGIFTRLRYFLERRGLDGKKQKGGKYADSV